MAASSSFRCRYHAFLSFRGEDTRKGFTDHLYRALEGAGIHTFRDDDEIERGAEIKAELQKAIQESRVSIVVFSKDYASSTWCLDELAMIMKRRTTDGHMVVPVFYHVDPSHVRKQTGSFAEAFGRHEQRFKEEMDKVEDWRRALRSVADLSGMVLGDGYEGLFIQDIVEEVRIKLDHKPIVIPPFMVGMDHLVKGINMWLKDGSNDVGVAVICGMGGIGKTTIAKVAYNLNFDRFQGSSFLADIRANSVQPKDLVRLQRQLLSSIQKGKAEKIYSTDEGIGKIQCAVCCKRVLIVLDDVDHLDQFSAILGMREWLHPGSKIIITTRREHLLKDDEVYAMFRVQGLPEDQSLELFSWHAFRKAHPDEGYMELSKSVVQHCGGLPLALKVIGSSLSREICVDVWRSALQKLEVIPDGEIQKILRISYDSLNDDDDRELFLHIACFFIGKKQDYTIIILDNLDFHTRIGIENLVDRCLLEINEQNKLVMHQLLRDMGRGIVREKSLDPGKRSRVWHYKEASNILRKLTGTETIKGFMLNLPVLMEDESTESIFSQSNKKRCYVDDSGQNCSRRRRLDFFSWKPINFCPTNSGFASNEVDFKTEAFRRMHNLEILLLNNVKVSGSYENFPKNLIWLSWQGFHLKSVPAVFYLENLVVLELQNSSLQHVWKGTKCLLRLKILNLSHSHGLMTTSKLSGLPSLERLILKDCINLVEVDESIGNLKKLVSLNLRGCKNLIKLPRSINMLESLTKLNLSGCAKLDLQANMASDMNKVGLLLTKLWQSIWSPVAPRKGLELTRLSLANLPHSLGSLNLGHCNLTEIPNDICSLSSLKYLDLRGNPILSLPVNMSSLIKLEVLLLNNCTNLIMLPELPPCLEELRPRYCASMKRVKSLPNACISWRLEVWGCKRLVEVQSLFKIKPLRSIDIKMIKDMGLFNLESVGSTDEVEMFSRLTHTTMKGPPQGVYECGIFSTFLYGNKIPEWYIYRSKGDSVLSITLPSHLNLKIQGLNACVVYSQKNIYDGSLFLKVSNDTKGLMWAYSPVTMAVSEENTDVLWLSHWLFGDDELEGGNKLRVSLMPKIKEFGIQLVYKQENQGVLSNGKDIVIQPERAYWRQNVDVAEDVSLSASKYQFRTGQYLLFNQGFGNSSVKTNSVFKH